jgi:winged helix DNA-binding protein
LRTESLLILLRISLTQRAICPEADDPSASAHVAIVAQRGIDGPVLRSVMTPRELTHWRLANQQISSTDRKTTDPGALVASLGAIQAQDYPSALWAIALRLPGLTENDITQAIVDRRIVRTWPMRGTLHFVAPEDIRWMLALLTPRIIARSAGKYRQLELNENIFIRSRKQIASVLRGGNRLIRNEMYAILNQAGISTEGQRGIQILCRLSQEALICFGPHKGRQPTFVLLDEWVSSARSLDRAESLAEMARRYFTGHGPATLQDFVWWSGLKVSDASAGVNLVSSELAKQTINEKIYWMPPKGECIGAVSSAIHLLPGFDEYMLGYTDRTIVLDPVHTQKIVSGNNGRFTPSIVISGRIQGTWKRVTMKNRNLLVATPFIPLNKTQTRALDRAVVRYGHFAGIPFELCYER